ncbi:MAG TPA: magnesium/cobalt transporter CorA [Chloroflexota bacterium]|nr:magnesium/cobalt transporter CorA [Chloroflexota bacterium]
MAVTAKPAAETARRNWSVMAYHVREGFRDEVAPGEVLRLLADPEWQLWLDVTAPNDADVQFMREVLRFHPLAIEDVVQQHQRPKIDQYEGYAFLVLYAGKNEDTKRPLHELNVFAGKNYLVTLHNAPLAEIDTARGRWKQAVCDPSAGLAHCQAHGAEVGLYVVLDSVVDAYFPLMDELGEELEQVETRVLTRSDRGVLVRDLLRLRKRLLQLRRVLAPTRDVVNQLARRELDLTQSGLSAYYLDVYDHLVRVVDTADVYRDMIASALEAYLSVSSFRLNETMRTMTALATILMSLTLVSSVYGMNFEVMPELKWPLGYPFALGLMLFVGVALFYWFRRRRWL